MNGWSGTARSMLASGAVFICAFAGAQEARWVVTQTWSGSGTMQTEMFRVNGVRWRIRHSHKGSGLFQIGVYSDQGRLLDMAASVREPIRAAHTLPGRGPRYLAINGVDTNWEVTVEQYLSVIEEWQLTQWSREPLPALRKLATWVGEDTESSFELTVPEGSWRVVHTNDGTGMLQVTVEDENGDVVLAANTNSPGESRSWVHRSGKFVLKVKAIKTKWKVEVHHQ